MDPSNTLSRMKARKWVLSKVGTQSRLPRRRVTQALRLLPFAPRKLPTTGPLGPDLELIRRSSLLELRKVVV